MGTIKNLSKEGCGVFFNFGGSSRVPTPSFRGGGVSRDRDHRKNNFLLQACPLIDHHPSIHFAPLKLRKTLRVIRRRGVVAISIISLLTNNINADTLFKPKKLTNISQVPPFASNLNQSEREVREENQLEEFEDSVKKILHGNDKDLETVSNDLSKHPEKLERFLDKFTTKKQVEKKENHLTKDLRKLLYSQYEDSKLKKNKITLNLKKATIRDVLNLIENSAKIKFLIDSNVNGEVKNINFQKVTPSLALRILFQNNNPKLSLVKEDEIFRVVLFDNVKEVLQEIQEKDLKSSSANIPHAQWNETIKMQIDKMWHEITHDSAGDKTGFYLVFDENNKKVFFKGRRKQVDEFKRFLRKVNQQPPTVKIEARFVCAEKGFEENIGFQWSGIYNRRASNAVTSGWNVIGGGKPLSQINNAPTTQTQDSLVDWALNFLPTPDKIAKNISLPFIFGGSDLNTKRLNLVLNAAENRQEIKTILNPIVLSNDKEMSEILVGENIPIETVVEESIEGKLRNIQTANYKDIGIQLKVKPIVSPDNKSIFMDIFLENSTQSSTLELNGHSYPIIRSTRSKNKVQLKSGETTMISGLTKDIQELYKTNLPGLGKIPILGWLFKGRRKVYTDMQLLIFITPTII